MRLIFVVLGLISSPCFAEPSEESIAECKAPKYLSTMQKDADARYAKANHADEKTGRTPANDERMTRGQRF